MKVSSGREDARSRIIGEPVKQYLQRAIHCPSKNERRWEKSTGTFEPHVGRDY